MNIKSFLYVSGLIFLLLLSPCNIRKPLQSTFGIPQTEVHNVNKATVNSINCAINSLEEAAYVNSSIAFQPTKILINTKVLNTFPKIALNDQSHISESRESWNSTSEIPFYILFQKLKLHV